MQIDANNQRPPDYVEPKPGHEQCVLYCPRPGNGEVRSVRITATDDPGAVRAAFEATLADMLKISTQAVLSQFRIVQALRYHT
jgi:hypothetical protein